MRCGIQSPGDILTGHERPQRPSLPSPSTDNLDAYPGSKRTTPACALWQETAATLDDRLAEHLRLFTDGSVLSDSSAAAACVVPSLELHNQCRVMCGVSSTIPEHATLDLAANALIELKVSSAAVLSNSRAALQLLARSFRGPPIATRIVRKLEAVQGLGCDLVLQWISAHVGIPGNEVADELAKAAHSADTPLTAAVNTYNAQARIRRSVAARHPDPARQMAAVPLCMSAIR